MIDQRNVPNALFQLHGHHLVKVYLDDSPRAECDTCALSLVEARAAVFAAQNGIFKMTFNGADLVRR